MGFRARQNVDICHQQLLARIWEAHNFFPEYLQRMCAKDKVLDGFYMAWRGDFDKLGDAEMFTEYPQAAQTVQSPRGKMVEAEPAREDGEEEKWPCDNCTFENHGLLLKCEQYETPRTPYSRHLIGTKQGVLCSVSAAYMKSREPKRSCGCGGAKPQMDPYKQDGDEGFRCNGCNKEFPNGTLCFSCQGCEWDMCMECINDDEENNEDCVVM